MKREGKHALGHRVPHFQAAQLAQHFAEIGNSNTVCVRGNGNERSIRSEKGKTTTIPDASFFVLEMLLHQNQQCILERHSVSCLHQRLSTHGKQKRQLSALRRQIKIEKNKHLCKRKSGMCNRAFRGIAKSEDFYSRLLEKVCTSIFMLFCSKGQIRNAIFEGFLSE